MDRQWQENAQKYIALSIGIAQKEAETNLLSFKEPLEELHALENAMPPKCGQTIHIVVNSLLGLSNLQGENSFFMEGVLGFYENAVAFEHMGAAAMRQQAEKLADIHLSAEVFQTLHFTYMFLSQETH